jgi:hypothetical protein
VGLTDRPVARLNWAVPVRLHEWDGTPVTAARRPTASTRNRSSQGCRRLRSGRMKTLGAKLGARSEPVPADPLRSHLILVCLAGYPIPTTSRIDFGAVRP